MTSAETRHKARTTALKILFESDLTPHQLDEVLDRYLDLSGSPEPVQAYMRAIVEGVRDNQEAIDAEIARAAPQFPVNQLAAIDRNVLRIAVFELRFAEGVPLKAAINEAVDIAKRFGGDSSQRFVNGVLGNIARDIAATGEGR
jgi:transcription antitermination protein NusB